VYRHENDHAIRHDGWLLAGSNASSFDVAIIFREKYSRGKRRKGSERKCDNFVLL